MPDLKPSQILNGHNSFETAYKVEDYPYGIRLRTTIFYWIETQKNKGDRFCYCTIDPKSGRLNKPKKSTYVPFMYMYIGSENHVHHSSISVYKLNEFPAALRFIVNTVQEITDQQVANLRAEYYVHLRSSYGYNLVKYNDERKPLYTEWMKQTLKHVLECEFTQMCTYPHAPEEDMPEAEIKFTVVNRE